MNMKFYMTPGSCSTAIHIILEELEEVFEAHIVNLPAGDNFRPEFLAINPKGNIPALMRPDGSVLTEVPAIAYWLGRARGRGKLWPKDIEDETRAVETMTFVAGSMHGHGFARIFAPGAFCADSSQHESIKAQGRALVAKGFGIIDKTLAGRALEGRTWIAGDFSVADPVLFYVAFWADKLGMPLPVHVLAHYRAMLARPKTVQVLKEEGYRPDQLGYRPIVATAT